MAVLRFLSRLPLGFLSFAAGSIGLLAGGVLLVQLATEALTPAPPPPPIVLAEPELAPPVESADFLPPDGVPEGETYQLALDLAYSDTVDHMLADLHIGERERKRADNALQALLGDRKLATGEQISLVLQPLREPADGPRLVSLSVRPRPEREFVVSRQADGAYAGEEKVFKLSPRVVRVNATLSTSILEDGMRAGAPSGAVNEFIKALSYDVDFQRELRAGQRFFLLLEQLVTSDGTISNPGRLLAGEIVLNARIVSAVRFAPTGEADQFYNLRGESMARSFLRTPLSSWRITSEFGMREHPILGYTTMHKGVDFGAAEGTPVLAAAAGTVDMAGEDGGHGLYVKIAHGGEVATGYAHLSRLGPGIRPGVPVRQGQLIGFVGATGLATGPHLHYEFFRQGKAVDPMAEQAVVRPALSGAELDRFRAQLRTYIGYFKTAPTVGDGSSVIPQASVAPKPSVMPPQAMALAKPAALTRPKPAKPVKPAKASVAHHAPDPATAAVAR
jgi:murein DD-endopeptidase MepM/ murein hydrolase activator NlpD